MAVFSKRARRGLHTFGKGLKQGAGIFSKVAGTAARIVTPLLAGTQYGPAIGAGLQSAALVSGAL
eukprot:31651-Eustigmatos_ZCMA.PRE.1